jgi:hypothetical protein
MPSKVETIEIIDALYFPQQSEVDGDFMPAIVIE